MFMKILWIRGVPVSSGKQPEVAGDLGGRPRRLEAEYLAPVPKIYPSSRHRGREQLGLRLKFGRASVHFQRHTLLALFAIILVALCNIQHESAELSMMRALVTFSSIPAILN